MDAHYGTLAHGPEQMADAKGDQSRIIVGVDDTPGGLAAVAEAIALARLRGAPLVAIRTWGLGQPRHGGRLHLRREGHSGAYFFEGAVQRESAALLVRRVFTAVAGGLPPDLSVSIETPEGDPAAVLSHVTTGSDVLVVGSETGSWFRHAVHGSVGRYCTEHCRCRVVLASAEPPDFRMPIPRA
jgi:nucleotide-binding universal stress UspA family protein